MNISIETFETGADGVTRYCVKSREGVAWHRFSDFERFRRSLDPQLTAGLSLPSKMISTTPEARLPKLESMVSEIAARVAGASQTTQAKFDAFISSSSSAGGGNDYDGREMVVYSLTEREFAAGSLGLRLFKTVAEVNVV
jgi:hypothetical protein